MDRGTKGASLSQIIYFSAENDGKHENVVDKAGLLRRDLKRISAEYISYAITFNDSSSMMSTTSDDTFAFYHSSGGRYLCCCEGSRIFIAKSSTLYKADTTFPILCVCLCYTVEIMHILEDKGKTCQFERSLRSQRNLVPSLKSY